jgi:hypothetical protein
MDARSHRLPKSGHPVVEMRYRASRLREDRDSRRHTARTSDALEPEGPSKIKAPWHDRCRQRRKPRPDADLCSSSGQALIVGQRQTKSAG